MNSLAVGVHASAAAIAVGGLRIVRGGREVVRGTSLEVRAGAETMPRRIVGRLSGGERARVSLATALLGAPSVLVLDEPTVGLDPRFAATCGTCFTGPPRRRAAARLQSRDGRGAALR